MIRLLDTSICVPMINRTGDVSDPAVQRLLDLSPGSVCLCSVVKAELEFGARNSSRVADNLQRVAAFCDAFQSLPFDDAAAGQYGVVRADLRREGAMIGANDLMIASIALSRGLILVTRNAMEFRRVPGLRVEVW